MTQLKYAAFSCLLWALIPGTGFTAPINQWASSVIDFSSQWSSTSWSAQQALGDPDTFVYGDISTAWAPRARDGSLEYLTLSFSTPVYATGAIIRETYGNGFVYQVDVLDTNNVLQTVWTGSDTSLPGTPIDFFVGWAMTHYLVSGLKIYSDSSNDLSAWEEIDAVQLQGSTVFQAPTAPTSTLLLAGASLLLMRIRKNAPLVTTRKGENKGLG